MLVEKGRRSVAAVGLFGPEDFDACTVQNEYVTIRLFPGSGGCRFRHEGEIAMGSRFFCTGSWLAEVVGVTGVSGGTEGQWPLRDRAG